MAAQQAITDFYTPETKEAKADAERWLLVAYEANRGMK
jgi:hypothetical protein